MGSNPTWPFIMESNYPPGRAKFIKKVKDKTDGEFWLTSNGREATDEEALDFVERYRLEARKTTQVGEPFVKYVGHLKPLDDRE